MNHLVGGGADLGWTALKALLLFATAVVGFRFGDRRALAEMAPFDFVVAVAVGAIIGRVPNSNGTSYLAGAVTLVTLLVAHRLLSRARRHSRMARVIDPPARLLVVHGEICADALERSGIARNDLESLLRQRGFRAITEVDFVVFEQSGQMSAIRAAGPGTPPLIASLGLAVDGDGS